MRRTSQCDATCTFGHVLARACAPAGRRATSWKRHGTPNVSSASSRRCEQHDRELGAIADVEALEHLLEADLDRVDRDAEVRRDLGVGIAARRELCDLELPRREALVIGGRGHGDAALRAPHRQVRREQSDLPLEVRRERLVGAAHERREQAARAEDGQGDAVRIRDGYNARVPAAGLAGEPYKLRRLATWLPLDHAVAGLVRDRLFDNALGLVFSAGGIAIGLPRRAAGPVIGGALWTYAASAAPAGIVMLALAAGRAPGRRGVLASHWTKRTSRPSEPLPLAAVVQIVGWSLATRILQTFETALLLS